MTTINDLPKVCLLHVLVSLDPKTIHESRIVSRLWLEATTEVFRKRGVAEMTEYRVWFWNMYYDPRHSEDIRIELQNSGFKIVDCKIVEVSWRDFGRHAVDFEKFGWPQDVTPTKYHLSRMFYAVLYNLFGKVVTWHAIYCFVHTHVDRGRWPLLWYVACDRCWTWANDPAPDSELHVEGDIVSESLFIEMCRRLPTDHLWYLVNEASWDDPELRWTVDWDVDIPQYD